MSDDGSTPDDGSGSGDGSGQQYGEGWGRQPVAPRNSSKAIAALVCGIVSIPMCGGIIGFIPAIAGIVLGVVARREIAASDGVLQGARLALAGIVCGIVGALLFVLSLTLYLTHR